MAENDAQRNAIMYGISALTRHFKDRPDVYVSGDLLIYYEKGNPEVSIAPDVFVVFGVENRERLNYKLWEERHAPAFVLEVASPSTWRDDLGRKRSVYARLGVREYWQYDPAGEHLPARLQGERLTPSGYERQPAATALDGTLTLRSETLGLELRAAPGREMRFRNPATGDDLHSHDEGSRGPSGRRGARGRTGGAPPQAVRLKSAPRPDAAPVPRDASLAQRFGPSPRSMTLRGRTQRSAFCRADSQPRSDRTTSVARRRPPGQRKTAAPAGQFVGRRWPNGRWPSARCITSYCTPMMWPMASIQ